MRWNGGSTVDNVRTLLEEQVRGEAPASTISVARAVTDGRRTIKVRRVTFSASVAVAVALVAASAVWLDDPDRTDPMGGPTAPASRSVRPSVVGNDSNGVPPSGWVLPSGEGPGPANLPVVSGVGISGGPAVVRMPGGGTVTLPTPPGTDIGDVVRVPGGWVFERVDGDQTQRPVDSVWYLPDGGTPRKVTAVVGGFAVSDDGTVLVVAGVGSGQDVAAYRLPSLTVIRQTTFAVGDGLGPVVHSYHADWVLLAAVSGEPGPSPAELWNVVTGAVVPFAIHDGVWGIGVSVGGAVLREVFPYGSATVSSCIDLVIPGTTVPTGLTGFCSADAPVADEAWLSPTGQWAVFHNGDGTEYVVATSELDAGGDLHVDYIPPDASVLFWDTNYTFVAMPKPGPDNAYYYCDQRGRCSRFDITPDGIPVQVLGG
jgi:hypothetical protein